MFVMLRACLTFLLLGTASTPLAANPDLKEPFCRSRAQALGARAELNALSKYYHPVVAYVEINGKVREILFIGEAHLTTKLSQKLFLKTIENFAHVGTEGIEINSKSSGLDILLGRSGLFMNSGLEKIGFGPSAIEILEYLNSKKPETVPNQFKAWISDHRGRIEIHPLEGAPRLSTATRLVIVVNFLAVGILARVMPKIVMRSLLDQVRNTKTQGLEASESKDNPFAQNLVDERNAHMLEGLFNVFQKEDDIESMAVIVGAGHIPGLLESLKAMTKGNLRAYEAPDFSPYQFIEKKD